MALHFLSIFWKVLFATIPPPSYCGGWLTFTVALVYIAMLTAVIGDAAGQLGCAVGLSDLVTAISLVAVGTSLPDLFASKQAVTDGTNADAAVGNITGSNSVNVFLGLGLPWLLASLYYTSKGERFCYPVSGGTQATPAALPLPCPALAPAPALPCPAPVLPVTSMAMAIGICIMHYDLISYGVVCCAVLRRVRWRLALGSSPFAHCSAWRCWPTGTSPVQHC